MRYLLYFLLIYFSIRFIFNFLIPVIRTTRQFKSQIRQFQSQMQQTHAQQEDPHTKPVNRPAKTEDTDYIDFEEIKS